MRINPRSNIVVNIFVYQDPGMLGSAGRRRHCASNRPNKTGTKKKKSKAKSHSKPLAISIDMTAGVTTLIVLAVCGEFLLITHSQ